MGADLSTERMSRLTAMGFTVEESRAALEQTNGDVQRAAELLIEQRRRRQASQGGALVYRINQFLQNQRTWDEFFAKFLWPEHLNERIQTNLFHYRANYFLICSGILGVSLLVQPGLLVLAGLCAAGHFAAAEKTFGQNLITKSRVLGHEHLDTCFAALNLQAVWGELSLRRT